MTYSRDHEASLLKKANKHHATRVELILEGDTTPSDLILLQLREEKLGRRITDEVLSHLLVHLSEGYIMPGR